MKDLLNSISVLATFVTAIGIIYLLLDNTVGRIGKLRVYHISKSILLKDAIFVTLAIAVIVSLLILNVISFYKPWH